MEEEGNIIIQNPNTEVIELRPGEGETSHWMRDILHHIKDSEDWQKAATSPMDVLSPSKVWFILIQFWFDKLLYIWGGGKEENEEKEQEQTNDAVQQSIL